MKSKRSNYKRVFRFIILFQEFKAFGSLSSGWQITILPNIVMGAAVPKPPHYEDSHPLMGVAPGQGGFLIFCNVM